MAEGEDKSQKTEEPTPKKLADAREKGEVASSREVNNWFMILAATLVVVMLAPGLMKDIANILGDHLANLHAIRIDRPGLVHVGAQTFKAVILALFPTLLLLAAAAVGSSLVQHGPVMSAERIRPKLENISLIKGFGRLFSARSVMEVVKGVLKLAIVAGVATMLVVPELDRITTASALDPMQLLDLKWGLIVRMFAGVCAVITVIAVLDLFYQKFEFHKSMKMSRQEIKDELKQSEGDPMIKARLRQLRLERARKRMMAAVPQADVVIANPTHYAVALEYDPDTMAEPRMLAKGVDTIAVRIREVAEENGVTVVENPPLARALYSGVEIDEEIPETYYKAVAEVIGYVWRLKRRAPPRATA